MARQRPHSHPCDHCKTPVECGGAWLRNEDGFPETICSARHRAGGEVVEVLCEDCQAAKRSVCACGAGWRFDFQAGTVTAPSCTCEDDTLDGDADLWAV